jgi:flagellar capping protein FliD
MIKRNKYETYYAVRETCPQPYYDVQINVDDIGKKVIDYVKKYPEALNRVVIAIYSSGDPCNIKLYDTVEEANEAIEKAKKGSLFGSSYEHIVRIRKKVTIITEEETIIADVQFPN